MKKGSQVKKSSGKHSQDPLHFFFGKNLLRIPLKRKGIYLLPNLFTLASLFSGFYGIVAATHSQFVVAAVSIFVAMVFDALDGRVARLIHAQSAFGAELDSLTDMVCFGIGVGLIIYHWSLVDLKLIGLGKIAWLSAFLYVACVSLRLARFNTSASDKRYFQGLPCPSAAGLLMAWMWFCMDYDLNGIWLSIVSGALCIGLALLMVSSVPYRSFKDLKLNGKIKFAMLTVLVIALVLLAIWPSQVLLVTFGAHVFSGVYVSLMRLVMKGVRRSK